ncbi:hypothetical protein FQN54_005529 [Arachnomyces sp. PD_36]|nr:hypothetical protein FQN54_005529 [Arachnomyces sp. PD_36]
MSGEATQSDRNLLIVSNRLPLSIKHSDNGGYETTLSSGGLVSSLSGLSKTTKFRWFGWPGIEVDESEKGSVRESLASHDAYPVFISNELADKHYNGFSNSILWPILHYQISSVQFEDSLWDAYREVNSRFAVTVAEEASDGCLIWIHDYHLTLLPQMLRQELAKRGKTAKIGFSLHTAFPASEVYKMLPVSSEALQGILESDLVSFHTDDYVRNFLSACTNILNLKTDGYKIYSNGRTVEVDKFVVGIDPEKFYSKIKEPQVTKRISEIEEKYKGSTIISGVDRLDYIKGLPHKLRGFEMFLQENPELATKTVLIQVAVPSREDVKEYQQLESDVSEMVGRINGKYGTTDHVPIVYLHKSIPIDELAALYAASDVCLLASTRDGMNLVAFEYVASQRPQHCGVLVLSEFAGAARFLNGKYQFNPSNLSETSDAIRRAVTASHEEKLEEITKLSKFVKEHTR